MTLAVQVDRYLESLHTKQARHYIAALRDLLEAVAMQDRPAVSMARERLEDIMRETMGIAELLGAASMLREAAPVAIRMRRLPSAVALNFAEELLANVTFEEALDEFVTRTPVTLQDAAERTAQRIAQLYGEGRVVAFAKSAEEAVTQRVRDLIAQAVQEGIPEANAGRLIKMGVDRIRTETEAWTEAYARMAFRTNLNTAVTAGRFRQVQDPSIRSLMPAFRFDAVADDDTRDNHGAADGRIFRVDNPIWNRIAPPLGYNSFVPGTRVTGQVDTASKAWYSGPLVVLLTRKGGRLTVTPNHPVMVAGKGFQPAGSVHEGDHLVRHLPTVESLRLGSGYRSLSPVAVLRRAVDNQQVVPRIEDVFHAARMQGATPAVEGLARPLPLDFHGDVGFYDGEVHVVSLDRLLPDDGGLEAGAQSLTQSGLMPSANSPGLLAHASSLVLLGRGGPCLLGAVPGINASRLQSVVDGTARDTMILGQLEHRFASEVEIDEVVRVEVEQYSGHVYDLQSPFGWIVANGFVASNCRCRVVAMPYPLLEAIGRIGPDGGVVEDRLPSGAFPDPGFRHGGRPDLFMVGK